MRKKGIPEIAVSRELLESYRQAVLEITCYAIKHGITGFGVSGEIKLAMFELNTLTCPMIL